MLGLLGCGGAAPSTRIVETPGSTVLTYGAPHDVNYTAEVDPSLEQLTLTIYKRARCDITPVTLMDRYEEKLQGDRVVEKTSIGKRQVAGKSKGEIDCNQSYANNVDVLLELDGGGRFSLGKTDGHGVVSADLNSLFKTASIDLPSATAKVVVRPIQAQPSVVVTQIAFTELTRQQEQLVQLLTELRALLDTGSELSQKDSSRAYDLYFRIFELAPGDPRTKAIGMRFWEQVQRRKQVENTQDLSRNLEALGQARETLKIMGDAAIPIYVQVAVNSGTLDQKALEWSSLLLMSAIKSNPSVCMAGYGYGQLPGYGFTKTAQLAAQYAAFGGIASGSNLGVICN